MIPPYNVGDYENSLLRELLKAGPTSVPTGSVPLSGDAIRAALAAMRSQDEYEIGYSQGWSGADLLSRNKACPDYIMGYEDGRADALTKVAEQGL